MTTELQTTEQTTAQALIQILTLNKNTGTALEKLLKLPLLDADNKIPAGVLRIVGALSDGHIIESGDNANGYYVRFADGTQICWRTRLQSTAATGNLRTCLWSFPAQFIGVPDVLVSWDTTALNMAMMIYTISATDTEVSMTFSHNSVTSLAGILYANCLAIGGWKE